MHRGQFQLSSHDTCNRRGLHACLSNSYMITLFFKTNVNTICDGHQIKFMKILYDCLYSPTQSGLQSYVSISTQVLFTILFILLSIWLYPTLCSLTWNTKLISRQHFLRHLVHFCPRHQLDYNYLSQHLLGSYYTLRP